MHDAASAPSELTLGIQSTPTVAPRELIRVRKNLNFHFDDLRKRACYFYMSQDSRSDRIRVRVIRGGLPEPPDDDWSMASPEERIEAVWMLTELCRNDTSTSEPKLQRTVTRLQRAQRER